MKRLAFFLLCLLVLMMPALAQGPIPRPNLPAGPTLIPGDPFTQLIDRFSGGGSTQTPGLCTFTAVNLTPPCNGYRGLVTTQTLTNAQGASVTYTISDPQIIATSVIECNLQAYTGAGIPVLISCTPGAGTLAVVITNASATLLNAAATISFIVFN
jgi:hypothetical protein